MPKMNYNTIVAPPVNGKPLGTRNETSLKGIFSSSPLYSQAESSVDGEGKLKLTDPDLKTWFLDHVVNGAVPGSDGYYGFSEAYDRDFTGAAASNKTEGGGPPDYSKVKTGAGGLPATSFVPNPSSPGEGNGVNAESKPAATDFANQISAKKPSTPGSGDAANESSRNPAIASAAMKTLTLGQLMGKSPASAKKG